MKDVIRFLLINSYAYNTDTQIFFTDIFAILENSDIQNKTITGEWNTTLNQSLDTYVYIGHNDKKNMEVVQYHIKKYP